MRDERYVEWGGGGGGDKTRNESGTYTCSGGGTGAVWLPAAALDALPTSPPRRTEEEHRERSRNNLKTSWTGTCASSTSYHGHETKRHSAVEGRSLFVHNLPTRQAQHTDTAVRFSANETDTFTH